MSNTNDTQSLHYTRSCQTDVAFLQIGTFTIVGYKKIYLMEIKEKKTSTHRNTKRWSPESSTLSNFYAVVIRSIIWLIVLCLNNATELIVVDDNSEQMLLYVPTYYTFYSTSPKALSRVLTITSEYFWVDTKGKCTMSVLQKNFHPLVYYYLFCAICDTQWK